MKTITIRPFAFLKLITLVALATTLLLTGGCRWVGVKGNGDIKTDTRQVQDFTTMEADGAFHVTWTTGAPALTITTDENLLEYIRTNVSDNKLRIDWVKPLRATGGIKINIASSALHGAELNGAVRLTAANVNGQNFFLEANGATRVNLDGSVDALVASLNGASRLDAEKLQTRSAELSINGAGRADVSASEMLKVAVSGAGKVTYKGSPKVRKEINGAGSVRRRD